MIWNVRNNNSYDYETKEYNINVYYYIQCEMSSDK